MGQGRGPNKSERESASEHILCAVYNTIIWLQIVTTSCILSHLLKKSRGQESNHSVRREEQGPSEREHTIQQVPNAI